MIADKTLLLNAIRQFVPVADTDEVSIDQLFEPYNLEPGDFFLQVDEICRSGR